MKRIDINCDTGEIAGAIADGSQEGLMAHITSVNVACGGHAGDESMMRATLLMAQRWGRQVGAHPGYPDEANFGRLDVLMSPADIATSIYEQIRALDAIARGTGLEIRHVKPHGALYNTACRNTVVANAIATGTARWSNQVTLVGLAGSVMLDVFRDAGFKVAAEGFADRRYESNGTLRPRRLPGALLENPETAAAQALRMVRDGSVEASDGSLVHLEVETICVHGDTPGAARIAAVVVTRLREAGVTLAALGEP